MGESPYKYFWRRARIALTGGFDAPDSIWSDSAEVGVEVQTGNLPMPLDGEYDGVGSILILEDEANIAVVDCAFEAPSEPCPAQVGVNQRLQHWRRIQSPLLDSARVNGTTVTLWGRNQHAERSFDSTMVFRNTARAASLGPTSTSWSDTGRTTGTYTYRLKHFSTPAMYGIDASPNSAASDSLVLTVGANNRPNADFTYSCQALTCTFTDASVDVDGTIVAWAWTFGDNGSSSQQNPVHTYAANGSYLVRLIVTDDDGASDTTTQSVVRIGPTVTVSGPTFIKTPGYYTWTANPSGGTPPYVGYQWWYQRLGYPAQLLQGETNPSYTRNVTFSDHSFRLTVYVTDSAGLVGTGSIVVNLNWGAGPMGAPVTR